ncbi:MAG: septum formation protein Maf [Firmicutes bacterium]|nr:septum formation protein Maf [Bacillota bacterium]
MNLILASRSPRRKDLLEKFGFDFSVQVIPTEEVESGDPDSAARANARSKALAVSVRYPRSLVLGADTIVVLDGRILGKPKDTRHARAMLESLNGRQHQVSTVVALGRGGQAVRIFKETTLVRFRQLSELEINGYLATGEPFDKAGSYGIQGFGGLLVESIKGCYYNVMGLPMPRLAVELRKHGIEVFS